MNEISFKATIRKVGNSHMITIPKEYIGDEVKENGTYFFTIKLNEGDTNESKERNTKT